MARGPPSGACRARPASPLLRLVIADTNVLLRVLEGDPGSHGKAARARVATARETGEAMTVLAATVLEAAFVLESAAEGATGGSATRSRARSRR